MLDQIDSFLTRHIPKRNLFCQLGFHMMCLDNNKKEVRPHGNKAMASHGVTEMWYLYYCIRPDCGYEQMLPYEPY